MRTRQRSAGWVSIFCLLSFTSCVARFRILPHNPDYLLQSPDKKQTPFPDVLQSYNGFAPGRPSIDLRPLMELRIENAYYEKGASRHGLKGFLGTEVAQYELTAAGLTLRSVQPMKSRPYDELPVQQLISQKQLAFPHYRFYFEIFLPGAGGAHASALLAANSPEELNQMTDPASVCSSKSINCTVFPEACSVSVEMRITVNGQPKTAFWSSTLASIANHPRHLEIKRLYAGRLTPIKINPHDPAALRLPLLPGDEIIWN